jgi:hypothetical protein
MLDSVHTNLQILEDAGLSAALDFLKPRGRFNTSK